MTFVSTLQRAFCVRRAAISSDTISVPAANRAARSCPRHRVNAVVKSSSQRGASSHVVHTNVWRPSPTPVRIRATAIHGRLPINSVPVGVTAVYMELKASRHAPCRASRTCVSGPASIPNARRRPAASCRLLMLHARSGGQAILTVVMGTTAVKRVSVAPSRAAN